MTESWEKEEQELEHKFFRSANSDLERNFSIKTIKVGIVLLPEEAKAKKL
jgi:hypothetical protein